MPGLLLRNTFLVLMFSLISSQPSYACSCIYAGKFTEYSKGHTVIRGEIAIYGPKLSHGNTWHETMKVSVTKVIKGAYPHSTIEFEGDPGNLCLSYVDSDEYPIGSEHLFTVFSDDKKQGLGGCGEVSVRIVDGTVIGAEMGDEEWIEYSSDYEEFIKIVVSAH